MGLFDSVQKGIEKASAETSRLVRVNRLKQQIDGKRIEITQQSIALANRTMELFGSGQPLPPELVGFCQAIVALQNQIVAIDEEIRQTQINTLSAELREVQGNTVFQGGPGVTRGIGMAPPPYPLGPGETGYSPPTVPVGTPFPPDYGTPGMPPAYGAPTIPPDYGTPGMPSAYGVPTIPPASAAGQPGATEDSFPTQDTSASTVLAGASTEPSSHSADDMETLGSSTEGAVPSAGARQVCRYCQSELGHDVAFCQECGRPVAK